MRRRHQRPLLIGFVDADNIVDNPTKNNIVASDPICDAIGT